MSTIPAHLLKTTPFIQLTDKNCLSTQLEGFCYVQKINQPIAHHITQLATALELVRLGMGCRSYLPVPPQPTRTRH